MPEDEILDDDLDAGIPDMYRLDEPEERFSPVADDLGGEGDAAGGASTPPPADENAGGGAWLDDPELVAVLEQKKWSSPADAVKAYQGLEELYGRQNQERDEQRKAWETERQQLLDALAGRGQQQQEPSPAPVAPAGPDPDLVDQINWEEFGRVTGADDGMLELYTRAILPLFEKRIEDKLRRDLAEQYQPIQEFTEQQRALIAFQSEIDQLAQEDPDLWEMTSEPTFQLLGQWEQQGVELTPDMLRRANAEALRQVFREARNQQPPPVAAVAPPVPEPVQQQPVQPQQSAQLADLQPLTSAGAAVGEEDPNEFWRRAIENAVPAVDGTDL